MDAKILLDECMVLRQRMEEAEAEVVELRKAAQNIFGAGLLSMAATLEEIKELRTELADCNDKFKNLARLNNEFKQIITRQNDNECEHELAELRKALTKYIEAEKNLEGTYLNLDDGLQKKADDAFKQLRELHIVEG